MLAFVCRLSGLRAVVAHCKRLLRTKNFSSLTAALRRASSLSFVNRLVETLEAKGEWGREELIAIDGMTVGLPKTQRHKCKKMNDKTVGGGVVWAYAIRAARGVCPVKVLQVLEGAWHDVTVMRAVSLVARGPVYLMDRGFYAFDLLEKWLEEGVHFIVRVREKDLRYDVIREISRPRLVGNLRVALDARVRLGGKQAKRHPEVRLVQAILPSGEGLSVVTGLLAWSAAKILDSYKQRWHIERFHRFLKDTVGLAHLYSFGQNGLQFLLYTALLLAILLFLSAEGATQATIDLLRNALRAVRSALAFGGVWKRNACTVTRRRRKPIRTTEKSVKR
jgi:hypothetical protein